MKQIEAMIKKSMDELQRMDTETFKHAKKIPIIVILDEVRSMHNVGSAFRTADSFRIEKIILCGLTPVPPHRDINKTALGATETVHWMHEHSTQEAIQKARKDGYKIYSIEQAHNSIALQKVAFAKEEKIAFVFGHEVMGVQEDIIKESDAVVEIPQLGTKHSLNISVSLGIVLWQACHIYFE
ncbi:MAG: RNA methyltransferase [Chitinophagaceae bacterium]